VCLPREEVPSLELLRMLGLALVAAWCCCLFLLVAFLRLREEEKWAWAAAL